MPAQVCCICQFTGDQRSFMWPITATTTEYGLLVPSIAGTTCTPCSTLQSPQILYGAWIDYTSSQDVFARHSQQWLSSAGSMDLHDCVSSVRSCTGMHHAGRTGPLYECIIADKGCLTFRDWPSLKFKPEIPFTVLQDSINELNIRQADDMTCLFKHIFQHAAPR